MHIKNIYPNIHKYLERFDFYKKIDTYIMKSRKTKLLIAIIILATLGTFIPPLVCWLIWLATKQPIQPLIILTDGDWITIISIIVPAYMGALTWEKHIALSNNIPINELDQRVKEIQNIQQSVVSKESDPDKDTLKDALTHNK